MKFRLVLFNYKIGIIFSSRWEIAYLLSVKPTRNDCFLFHFATVEHTPVLADLLGIPHILISCDVADPKEVNHTVASVIAQFKKIDILLNNAATKTRDLTAFFSPFGDYSLAAWREIMAVNLDGMFLMAQAVGKQMVSNRSGSIIQTASIYSMLGPDQRIYEGSHYLGREINTPAVYTASKAGVIGLTKHLAALWGSEGVRVNALCPGGVSSGQNEEFNKKYSARVPMNRMAKEIDIVGPMLFLASDASSYVTGQVLFADGGLSAW